MKEDEEEVVAHVISSTDPYDTDQYAGLGGFSLGHNPCPNCKKAIHTTPPRKKGQPVNFRCNRKDCECKCRTHYIGENGHLVPYGQPDPSVPQVDNYQLPRDKIDDIVDTINAKWNKQQNKVNTLKKGFKVTKP